MSLKLNIIRSKEEIRKELIRQLREQDPSLRKDRSRKVQDELLSSLEFKESRVVMAYVSLPTEVDTHYFIRKMLERGKKLAVPCINTVSQSIIASELTSIDELVEGPFGIHEPENGPAKAVSLKEIDLIVVPGIAFDRQNMRLGRGKGYFDRFLANEELSSSKTIGLAFSFQIVDALPVDAHDRPVHRVISA
ncbi:MAG: 5-formyltetrahydrofolate cyclo-ligase [Candidatus Omnitrophota bacterium]